MSEEIIERICKTCHWWRSSGFYCISFDTGMPDDGSCDAHETYEEMVERVNRENKRCRTHGLFQKDYNYCPYCGSILLEPNLVVVSILSEVDE